MMVVGLIILLGLTCLFPCEGKVSPPSAGTSLYFLRESTGKIVWSFDDVIDPRTSRRTWSFTSSDGKHRALVLAIIDGNDGGVQKFTDLFEFAVEKPATLVLKNVNLTYEGAYQFGLTPAVGVASSEVDVFITVTPMVEVDCSSPNTINATENFTCVCKAWGGRPPANVTWFKGNKMIGESKKRNQTLRLNNVGRDHNGTYRCEAKSHDTAINRTEIELIVNYPPENVKLTLTHSGSSATLKCSAEAQPTASFKIFLNETKLVSNDKDYTIREVNVSHVGNYTCVAENFLGSETSNSEYLSLEDGQTQTTTSSTIKPSPTTQKIASPTVTRTVTPTTTKPPPPRPEPESKSLPTWLIVLIVVIILLILLIIGIVVYRYKMKQKARGSRGNIGPVAGNHYELENECAGPGDNAYDSVGPVGTSSGKSKPPEKNTLPPVYAAVDKNNRQGNTLYASLDTDAMKPKRESKKEPERTPQTEYASIDFAKRADDNVPRADLV